MIEKLREHHIILYILIFIMWGVLTYTIHIHVKRVVPDVEFPSWYDLFKLIPLLVFLVFVPLCKRITIIIAKRVLSESTLHQCSKCKPFDEINELD